MLKKIIEKFVLQEFGRLKDFTWEEKKWNDICFLKSITEKRLLFK